MPPTTSRPTSPLRAAVVGSGAIAREHLSFLSGRSPIQPSRPVDDRILLAGVCDLSPITARYGADEFGAEGAYTDLEDELTEAEPDGWTIDSLGDRLDVDLAIAGQRQVLPVERIVTTARAAGVDLDTPHDRFGRSG